MSDSVLTRLLLVEDSSYMADAFQGLLALVPGLCLVGHAACYAEAIPLALRVQPDIAMVDLRIPFHPQTPPAPAHGLAVLRDLHSSLPQIKLLVLSSLPEQAGLVPAAQSGAVGYLSKDTSSAAIVSALQAVLAGRSAFTLDQLHMLQPGVGATLSPREREVLALLAEGASNQVIAVRLGISVGTARKHVERLCDFFQANSRGQVVAAAHQRGLL